MDRKSNYGKLFLKNCTKSFFYFEIGFWENFREIFGQLFSKEAVKCPLRVVLKEYLDLKIIKIGGLALKLKKKKLLDSFCDSERVSIQFLINFPLFSVVLTSFQLTKSAKTLI